MSLRQKLDEVKKAIADDLHYSAAVAALVSLLEAIIDKLEGE